MTEPKDDGGPAFPDHALPHRHNGMSLRDYFAAQALAFVAEYGSGRDLDAPLVARLSYDIADAMIVQRAK